jgi:hypothetical protein
MLTNDQRSRFRELQARSDSGAITDSEQEELDSFIHAIELDEAAYLRPATERIKAERAEVEDQNEVLRALLRRQERLAHRLERILEKSRTEQDAIKTKLSGILRTTAQR